MSFDLAPGSILGIIGPNGAGKTTIFDMISGFIEPDGGTISLHGADITNDGPDTRARRGLGRSFQDARLFPALTVAETLALAFDRSVAVKDPLASALRLPAVADSERALAARVEELLDQLGLGAFRDKFVSELSTGSRRIVDIGCAMAHRPSVLLLDEPSSGIAQRETEALGPVLLDLRETTGASFLLIEHDMPLVTSISDEILALDLGQVLTRGAPEDVISDPGVVESYLGESAAAMNRSGSLATTRR